MTDRSMLEGLARPFVLAQGRGVLGFAPWALPSGLALPDVAELVASEAPRRHQWYDTAAGYRVSGMRCHLVTHMPLTLRRREPRQITTRMTMQAASGLFDEIHSVRVLCGNHPVDAPANVRILIGVRPLWQWDASPDATLGLDESQDAAWGEGLHRLRTLAARRRCAVRLPTSAATTAVTAIADAVRSSGAAIELFADHAWITEGTVDPSRVDIRWASKYVDRFVMVQSSVPDRT